MFRVRLVRRSVVGLVMLTLRRGRMRLTRKFRRLARTLVLVRVLRIWFVLLRLLRVRCGSLCLTFLVLQTRLRLVRFVLRVLVWSSEFSREICANPLVKGPYPLVKDATNELQKKKITLTKEVAPR